MSNLQKIESVKLFLPCHAVPAVSRGKPLHFPREDCVSEPAEHWARPFLNGGGLAVITNPHTTQHSCVFCPVPCDCEQHHISTPPYPSQDRHPAACPHTQGLPGTSKGRRLGIIIIIINPCLAHLIPTSTHTPIKASHGQRCHFIRGQGGGGQDGGGGSSFFCFLSDVCPTRSITTAR